MGAPSIQIPVLPPRSCGSCTPLGQVGSEVWLRCDDWLYAYCETDECDCGQEKAVLVIRTKRGKSLRTSMTLEEFVKLASGNGCSCAAWCGNIYPWQAQDPCACGGSKLPCKKGAVNRACITGKQDGAVQCDCANGGPEGVSLIKYSLGKVSIATEVEINEETSGECNCDKAAGKEKPTITPPTEDGQPGDPTLPECCPDATYEIDVYQKVCIDGEVTDTLASVKVDKEGIVLAVTGTHFQATIGEKGYKAQRAIKIIKLESEDAKNLKVDTASIETITKSNKTTLQDLAIALDVDTEGTKGELAKRIDGALLRAEGDSFAYCNTVTITGGCAEGCEFEPTSDETCGACQDPPADPLCSVDLSKTQPEGQPEINADWAYTVTITNDGEKPLTNVSVLEEPNRPYVSSNPSVGTYDVATGVWSVGTVAVGETVTMEFVVNVGESTTTDVLNVATLTSDDLPEDEIVTAQTAVKPCTIQKADYFADNNSAQIGESVMTSGMAQNGSGIDSMTGADSTWLRDSNGYKFLPNGFYDIIAVEGDCGVKAVDVRFEKTSLKDNVGHTAGLATATGEDVTFASNDKSATMGGYAKGTMMICLCCPEEGKVPFKSYTVRSVEDPSITVTFLIKYLCYPSCVEPVSCPECVGGELCDCTLFVAANGVAIEPNAEGSYEVAPGDTLNVSLKCDGEPVGNNEYTLSSGAGGDNVVVPQGGTKFQFGAAGTYTGTITGDACAEGFPLSFVVAEESSKCWELRSPADLSVSEQVAIYGGFPFDVGTAPVEDNNYGGVNLTIPIASLASLSSEIDANETSYAVTEDGSGITTVGMTAPLGTLQLRQRGFIGGSLVDRTVVFSWIEITCETKRLSRLLSVDESGELITIGLEFDFTGKIFDMSGVGGSKNELFANFDAYEKYILEKGFSLNEAGFYENAKYDNSVIVRVSSEE